VTGQLYSLMGVGSNTYYALRAATNSALELDVNSSIVDVEESEY
jgi:hypothetical protein